MADYAPPPGTFGSYSLQVDSSGNLGLYYKGAEIAWFIPSGGGSSLFLSKGTANSGILISATDATPTTGEGGIRFDGANMIVSSGSAGTLYLEYDQGADIILGQDSYTLVSPLTGVFTSYAGRTTAGLGLDGIFGLDSRTGLAAADGSAVTVYAVPSAGGLFCIGASADITAIATAAATYTVTYTDINGTTHTLVPMSAQTAIGHYTVAPADSVWVKGSTNITSQLTGTFGTTTRINVYTSVREIQ